MPRVTELDVQDLLDRATLAADARWRGASVTDLEPLEGGVSSLTFAARLAQAGGRERRVVVKVAPPGLPPVRNRDVLRQARVLEALTGAPGVRVPEVLLRDGGSPPFFVMSFVEGESYEPMLDTSPSPPGPDTVDRRARAAARMLADLQSVAPASVGLGGEPALTPVEELDRWIRLYATCPEDLKHAEEELRARLLETVPAPLSPRILHGDFRMGNMQFAGERVTAIIDWEIWSVGDPRHDLAWLAIYTEPIQRFSADRGAAHRRAAEGMPAPEELVAEYRAARPGDLPALDWFVAAARYKMAATTAALEKLNRRKPTPDPAMTLAASCLADVLGDGMRILDTAAARR